MIDPPEPNRPPRGPSDASPFGAIAVDALTDAELGMLQGEILEPLDPEAANAEFSSTDDMEARSVGLGPFARSRPMVVLIGAQEVEVLVPRQRPSKGEEVAGPFRLVRFSHDLAIGKELAVLLAATLKAHGVRKQSLRVALSPELVPASIVELPALSPKDLSQVIARKSAAILEMEPKDVTYSALVLDGEDREERRWLVHTTHARPLVAFETEMRSLGWLVRDVVPARTAPFLSPRVVPDPSQGGHPDASPGDEGPAPRSEAAATLIVVFEREAAVVGLVSRGQLVHISTLPGGLHAHLDMPQTARALVQEIRGVDAFWRRSSRGDQVTHVTIVGSTREALVRLAPGIRGALGDVTVRSIVGFVPAAGTEDQFAFSSEDGSDEPVPGDASGLDRSEENARITLLRALASSRVAALDLSQPLRPRGRALLVVALASTLISGTVALGLRDGMNGLTASISTEARVVEASSSDLEELQARRSRAAAAEARVLQDCAELMNLSSLGIKARPIIEGLRTSFGDSTRLLSVRAFGRTVGGQALGADSSGVVQVRGLVLDSAGETARALGRLRSRLAALPGVSHVIIEPPSMEDRGEDGAFGPHTASLRFLCTASLIDPTGVRRAADTATVEVLPGENQ